MGLTLYPAINLLMIPVLRHPHLPYGRVAIVLYVVDLLFASMLIYYTGGLLSQLFLLYCLLPFKAALYYPYVHNILLVSFLIFPFYITTLFIDTGTLVYLTEGFFLARYGLLLLVVLSGVYTAWHLDSRHQQTRALFDQLAQEHHQVNARRRELRTILNGIVDGVIVADPDMRLRMINPVAADLLNLPYPQPPGTPLDALIDNADLLGLLRVTLERTDARDVLDDTIRTYPNSSRQAVICHAVATPLVSEEDTLYGAVVVLRDITRQIALEEAKSNFISVLSHELRTPLTAIRGFIELILSGGAGDITTDQKQYLDTAFAQTERLDNLITTLLDYAEMEANETELRIDLVPPLEPLFRALSRVEPHADQRRIQLESHVPPHIAPVRADPHRLEQVLLNLLENGIKFTPSGGTVTASITDQTDRVLFCVTDTGPGIPPAERARIFERFYQIDNSSTRQHGGTGLGLALCKHIVEMHGGRIWVEDPEEHPGSRFCFTIPRRASG